MTAVVRDAPLGAPRVDRGGRAIRRIRTIRGARVIGVSLGLSAAILVVFCFSISLGDFPIPVLDVLPAVFGHGNPDSDFIIRQLRLPRALTGLLVGGAFGLSGAVFQTLTRNPLASPDFIGITWGANAAAVTVLVYIGGGYVFVSASAFVGALLCAIAVYLISYRRGVSSYRLILVGIGVGAVMSAVVDYMLTRSDIYEAQQATAWLTGSLNGRSWDHVRVVGVVMLVLLPIVLLLGRPLRALQMGDEVAKGVGVSIERSKLALMVVGVALAAVATAAAGPVMFVAFVSPSIARRLVGKGNMALIPAGLVGALLTCSADLFGRRFFAPTELPVGVVTGVVGAPYLLWLLATTNRSGRGG